MRSAISRTFARFSKACNEIQESSSATGRKSLSSSFAAGTWNLGFDIDAFVASKKKGEGSVYNGSDAP
jgi:hypothetical protein